MCPFLSTVLVVAVLVGAACGGADDGAEQVSAPRSSEEICALAMADFDNVGPAPMSPDIAAIACQDHRIENAEFVTQANALCADVKAFNGELESDGTRGQLARRAEIGDVQLLNFRALKALMPLPDVEVTLDAAIELLAQAAQLRHEAVAAATAGDEAALDELEQRVGEVEREFAALASETGLTDCA